MKNTWMVFLSRAIETGIKFIVILLGCQLANNIGEKYHEWWSRKIVKD